MTNQFQTQQQLRTRIPTTITYRLILASRSRNKGSKNEQSGIKDKGNQMESDIWSNFESATFVYSRLVGDTNQTKRYAKEIVHHDRSTVELRYDGSIIVTPYSRQLPNEIVSSIICHLSNNLNSNAEYKTLFECTLVNYQFYAIANPLLWKALNFRHGISSERFLACLSAASSWQLKSLGKFIRELHLHGPHWKDAQLTRLLPYLHRLKYLAIDDHTYITDKSFKRLPYRCPHLTSLQLDLINLTELSFSAIGIHCRQLCDLDWNINKNQSSEWLAMIIPPCPLKRLRIRSLIRPLHGTFFTTIKAFHRLTCLDIMDVSAEHMNGLLQQNITTTLGYASSPLTKNTPLWPHLIKLALYPCNGLDDITVISFIKSHSYLEELHLRKATRLTDTTLHQISLPSLTHLTLTDNDNITADGVRRLVRQCGCLMVLILNRCQHVLPSCFPELWELHGEQELVANYRIISRIRQYKHTSQEPLCDDQRRLAELTLRRLEEEEEQRQRQLELQRIQYQIQQRRRQLQQLRQQEHQLQHEIQQHQWQLQEQ